MTSPIMLSSAIEAVVVHPKGAQITRKVTLTQPIVCGALNEGVTTTDLYIEGITSEALANSFRVRMDASEELLVVSVSATRRTESPAKHEQTIELDALHVDIQARTRHLHQLHAQLGMVQAASLEPDYPRADEAIWSDDPLAQLDATLQLSSFLDERASALSARIDELTQDLERMERDRQRANLDASQRTPPEAAQTWKVHVRCLGEGQIDHLWLDYVVGAVRWWPRYSLHLTKQSSHAQLMVQAVVAQGTKESWDHVRASFSTASLQTQAQLPKLDALRLGRAQAPKPSGFREAPKGIETLFASYDQALTKSSGQAPAPPSPAPPPSGSSRGMAQHSNAIHDGDHHDIMPKQLEEIEMSLDLMSFDDDSRDEESVAFASAFVPPPRSRSRHSAAPMQSSPPSPALSDGFGGGGAPLSKRRAVARPQFPQPPRAIEPDEQWLHFDNLRMASADQSTRGCLVREDASSQHTDDLGDVAQQAARSGLHDPLAYQGYYDTSYICEGTISVPCDRVLHHVSVTQGSADSTLWWRAAPLNEASVFRMVRFANPLPVSLLRGPVDVFVDGAYTLGTVVRPSDAGALVTVGLGEDEHVRVARNPRIEESEEGLISKKTMVLQHIDIEITSTHGFDLRVEVLDRVPVVAKDEDIEVRMVEASPPAQPFDQSREGAPAEGLLRWEIDMAAGQTKHIHLTYSMSFSSKSELVGGNRRD